jgi:hypothetical protein
MSPNAQKIVALIYLTTISIPLSYACFTGFKLHSSLTKSQVAAARKYWNQHSRKGRSVAADMSSVPWGGGDQKDWGNEAILANAVTTALNEGWKMSNVRDVLVSVPVKMMPGTVPNPADQPNQPRANWPYGDGQTNAHVTFGEGWNEKYPELVTTLVQFQSGAPLIRFLFHSAQPQTTKTIEIQYFSKNGTTTKTISNGVTVAHGDLQFDWKPSVDEVPLWGTLFENKVAVVHDVNSLVWFPVDFRNVMMSGDDLVAAVPETMRNYGAGLLDPEHVKVDAQKKNLNPFDIMNPDTFASDLNASRYFPVIGIHNAYYDPAGSRFDTAVGNGATTTLDPANPGVTSPFKMAYICFDPRNIAAESVAHAPSGGGWHEIGDPAETVINSLENSSVIFGYTNGMPSIKLSKNASLDHGLTDVAVIRRLPPGFGIVTAAGASSIKERSIDLANRGHDPANQRNYHWFIFDQPSEVCAFEWVHKCVPSATNSLGMSCN